MTSLEGGGGMDRDDEHGRPIVLPPGHPLSELLAAVTAPGATHELAGEDAAVAAFRATRTRTPVRARRGSWVGRLLTLKVAAAAVATMVTVGGMALATRTGALNGPVAPAASTVSVDPATPATPAPAASPRPGPPAATANPRRSGSAAPSRTSACPSARAWDDRRRYRDRGKRACRDVRPSGRSGQHSPHRRGAYRADGPAPGESDLGERAVRRAPRPALFRARRGTADARTA
ncbi:hypothetical protein [Actinoplanes aureus]|uniref:Uncharacterized protein n=1 Tax=Actinoplanes aureus TaxID=2792083 RepID=A0A931CGM5_9ACTN|nr:hypothetical protein [Actinoplanes aureus]MBG0565773.1 hypothetical protein [Actinoplanes aureus]